MYDDTIAAIATGMTDAGISIIRISGDRAIEVADSIFCSKSGKKLIDQKSHTMHFGYIVDNQSENELKNEIDEVLVSIMRNPHSYTGEDTVEINCHGGIYLTNKILEVVLNNGIRLAEPGEFTKRAFLSGKMDLSKAEAVMDLISSKNDFAAKNSIKQLKGNILDEIKELRSKIIYEIAFIESALDDPEHFDLSGYPENLDEKLIDIEKNINKLIENSKNGKIRKDGISSVIVGKPNAGKSSFLNLLIGEDKAIVTSTAGTTRDVLEESVKLGDMILHLYDTAGIRETSDEIEKIGVEKAKKHIEEADLILYMVDSSIPLDENDDDIIDLLNGRNYIVLLNKSDLDTVTTEEDLRKILGEDTSVIRISAKENIGVDEFSQALRKMFYNKNININDDVIITNTRQIKELRDALHSISLVRNSIADGMPEDFFSIDLTSAYEHLGFIIGEEINEDVVDEIFSKFCMGK